MKWSIKNRYSGKVQCAVEIGDLALDAPDAEKMGLAVCAGLRTGANLSGANLRGAYLSGAYLLGANLVPRQTRVSWSSRELLSEILWQAANTEPRQMLAAFVGRQKSWCWGRWATWQHSEREWAIEELRRWVMEGDDAPEVVQ